MTNRKSIAVVMTVFNRREKTEKCISSILGEIENNSSLNLDFYITDDQSSDGTRELIEIFRMNYPDINFIILEGSGNLFWNKGMHLAYGEALKYTYDFYLWVNNDVEFNRGFLFNLLKDYESAIKSEKPVIICGSVRYRDREELSYGASLNKSKVNPYNRTMLAPNGSIQKADCINANCLLIATETASLVGNLDQRYEHGFGDFDYGYKLTSIGGELYASSKFVGKCDRNSLMGSWKDSSLPITRRLSLKNKPTGQPPYSHKIFLKKWFPKAWLYYWLKPYGRILISSFMYKVRNRKA